MFQQSAPRRFRTPVHMLQALKQFLTEMYSKNYIRKSTSPYSSPVLVIPKPRNADGSSRGFRLVTDFRAINECVEPIQHYIPDIETMYAKLREAKYISTFDMKNGYWNAGVDDPSTDYLAFSTPWGTFAYQVLLMGFVSSAAHFQNWVEQKLRKHGILLEYAPFKEQSKSESASCELSSIIDELPHFKNSTEWPYFKNSTGNGSDQRDKTYIQSKLDEAGLNSPSQSYCTTNHHSNHLACSQHSAGAKWSLSCYFFKPRHRITVDRYNRKKERKKKPTKKKILITVKVIFTLTCSCFIIFFFPPPLSFILILHGYCRLYTHCY